MLCLAFVWQEAFGVSSHANLHMSPHPYIYCFMSVHHMLDSLFTLPAFICLSLAEINRFLHGFCDAPLNSSISS